MAWVPTAMSIEPSARPISVPSRARPLSRPVSAATVTGRPRNSCSRLARCWRARISVGASSAPCPPASTRGQQRHGGDQSLAGADVTLEQAEHGLVLTQIVADFAVRAALRAGEREGQLERLRQPPVARERPAPPGPHRVADEGEGELIGEHLVIAKPIAGEARLRLAMHCSECMAEGGPSLACEQAGLDPLRHLRQPFECGLDQRRQPAARDPLRQRVDRLDISQRLVGGDHVVGVGPSGVRRDSSLLRPDTRFASPSGSCWRAQRPAPPKKASVSVLPAPSSA